MLFSCFFQDSRYEGAGGALQQPSLRTWEPTPTLTVPIPIDDRERIEALESYSILRTQRTQDFDDWAVEARDTFGTQFSAISLIERDSQWLKASCGLELTSTPREAAFCAHTILYESPLVIEDTWLDKRFRQNELVTGMPFIRFYAGVPLITPEGFAIGAICVFDPTPRTPTPLQMDVLTALRDRVMIELELRRLTLAGRTEPAINLVEGTDRERKLLTMYMEQRRKGIADRLQEQLQKQKRCRASDLRKAQQEANDRMAR